MLGRRGISVTAWVNVDSTCEIKPEVCGEQLEIEFGPGSFGMVVTENMVDKLVAVFTAAKAQFQQLNAESEREELATG